MNQVTSGQTETPLPAFPVESRVMYSNSGEYFDTNGMTLRDYFAAKAIDSALDRATDAYEEGLLGWDDAFFEVARIAYGVADAMLEQRRRA